MTKHLWLAALLGLAPALAPAMAAAKPQPAAPNPPYPTAQAPARPFWAQRITGYIPMRDGTLLRYSALLPAGKGPFPVIINYSGYDPGAIGGKAYLEGNTAMSTNLDRTLVGHGYAVVGLQARGTGCSEGVFDFLGHAYGEDGRDAIEWLAQQRWSNGAIGMANWSWAGMSQIATAAEQPPHLKAIAPGMVLGDARLDSWAPGGVPAPGFVQEWWKYRASRWDAIAQSARAEGDSRCLAQIATNTATAAPHNLATVLIQHPLRDGFIEQRDIAARTHKISVPVLSMEAFQDEAVTSREGYYQDTLRPDQLWMVQTNGGHDLYESLAFRATLVRFFDRFVKGIDNGFDKGDHLSVWMETAAAQPGDHTSDETSAPRYSFTLPHYGAPVATRAFSLTGGGQLVEGAASGGPDTYRYPVPGPSVNASFGSDAWGPLADGWRQGSLAYTSAPLAAPLLAYGPASADLYVATSASDADLQVTLTELRPDGQEMFVQRGWLRLSDRAVDAARSSATHVVLQDTPATMQAMTPGEPALARVELNKLAHAFRAGSRLRLWVEAPGPFGGYGFNINAVPATNQLWHDAAHPSRLVLGVLSGISVPAAPATCGAVLRQPCRPDPLPETHP